MQRREMMIGLAALTAAGCSPDPSLLGPDGLPVPQVYRIGPGDTGDVQFRMLDGVNALRAAAGVPAVELDSLLNAAAATHARDMAVQNRPWLFGSDGSSPLDRARRAGFTGRVVGENISETYETELETLAAWVDRSDTRAVILDPHARRMGFSWFQERAGKIWWTLTMGSDPATSRPIASSVATTTPINTQG